MRIAARLTPAGSRQESQVIDGVGGLGRLLGNITIGKKLYGLAAALLVFVLVIGITSISSLSSANNAGRSMYLGSALPGLELGKISTATVDAHRSLLRTLLYPTNKTIYTQEVASRAKDNVTVSTELAALKKAQLPASERADLATYGNDWDQYVQLRNTALTQAFVQHNMPASLKTTITALDMNKAARAQLTNAIAVAQSETGTLGGQISSTYSSSRTLTIVLLLIAVALGAGIAFLIARSLTGPADAGRGQGDRRGRRRPEDRCPLDGRDRPDRPCVPGHGRLPSQAVNEAIGRLAEKSEQIGAIVQTITGIAEQTNLLALNAAIEAARAGEQGRGFAVVAEEVRKLAEESQLAAEEIAGLIKAIRTDTDAAVTVVENGARQTEEGTTVVERTRAAFVRIDGAVQDMTGRIEEIAAAAGQIASGAQAMQSNIGEVAAVAEESSASAEQVSASTEQTSASTQEMAASAQDLARTAEELNRLVEQFRVTG
jgi:hypothetical protein